MKRYHLILFLFAASALFGISCSSTTEKSADVDRSPAIAVNVANPLMNTDNSISVTGQIESAQSASISTRVMGYITSIKVKVGDHVQKGQLLATISSEDIIAKRAQADAMLTSAKAALASAEKDYQRFSNLFKQKSATAKELDNVTLQYESAKASVQAASQMKAEANSMLAYTNLIAPFSGVVAQKLADAGSMANPGMPILVLEQGSNLRVSAVIPETEIHRIKINAPANISIASANKTFNGTVTEISPSSMATGGQFLVKLSLPQDAQKELNAGQYANVSITSETQSPGNTTEMILIPSTAIHHVGQLDALYTIGNNDKALLRYVRLGKTFGDNVEVLSGLAHNESFIASSEGKLFNGATVRVK